MDIREQSYDKQIIANNYRVFALLSSYLNLKPDLISKEDIEEVRASGVSTEYAFGILLASALGLDIVDHPEDKQLFQSYFIDMLHKLDVSEYENNRYYKNIKIPTLTVGNCELRYDTYKPYEGFVCNDIQLKDNGRQIPQLGFFETEFKYPAVLENNTIWMTITPNEIETIKEPIEQAFGNVLTFGLGLGYYTYMVSEKENVDTITVVETNDDVIELFQTHILPQFNHAHKVSIVKADAFEYAEQHLSEGKFDAVFTDLWHDVSDGIDLYLKMRSYEPLSPRTKFSYWIEKSILCYL